MILGNFVMFQILGIFRWR